MKKNKSFDKDIVSRVKELGSADKLPHAVLITGENADTYADTLAAYLLCENMINAPCSACNTCKKILTSTHPDVITVTGGETKKSFHIDKIRDMRSDAYILPNEASYKVYILKDVQNLTEQAQNALLKILEEPPSFVVFVLIADSTRALLSTILSRVVKVQLPINDKANAKSETKASILSVEITKAILSANSCDLLLATSELIKSKNPAFLSQTFKDVKDTLCSAIKSDATGKVWSDSSEISEKISKAFTLEQINDMITTVDNFMEYLLFNANKNIMITSFCKAINDIKEK